MSVYIMLYVLIPDKYYKILFRVVLCCKLRFAVDGTNQLIAYAMSSHVALVRNCNSLTNLANGLLLSPLLLLEFGSSGMFRSDGVIFECNLDAHNLGWFSQSVTSYFWVILFLIFSTVTFKTVLTKLTFDLKQ
jgi:hypothetical protein